MSGPTLVRTAPREADWRRIPDGMRALWKACLPDEQGYDVARSLAINLIGVARRDDQDALRDALERLQRRTPCRAFLLLVDDGARPGTAELAATTRCHGNVRDIVLEEITIALPWAAFPQAAGLVRPLLMSDLANHLFWATAWPPDRAWFDALAAMCDHVIVDSQRFEHPAKDLAALQRRREHGQPVTDLTWLRVRPWRRALAEAFERVPWRTGTHVAATIRHGRAATAAAHLLAGWLRDRLQAEVELDTGGDDAARTPDGVVLHTRGFEVEMVRVPPRIRVHVTTPAHCYLPFAVPMSRGTEGDLLAAAIDMA